MSTVTIPKTKYREMKKKAEAYEHIFRFITGELFASPPTRNAKKTIAEFEKTGRYSGAFLRSLKKGLARSSYFVK